MPSKAACGVGQTRLMFDEQDFCGHVCKNDSDCPHGQVCTGKASLFANGKTGAEVSTCTIPASGAPTAAPDASAAPARSAIPPAVASAVSNAGKIVLGVQLPPLPGNVCPTGFTFGDKGLCHRNCGPGGACPVGSRCARGIGAAYCEAL